ncbi:MAG: hypothetical protein HeimAB125_07870 [Candidatus Heimdallarchaeota archaeon AB_125]|nr:MAG: hypothetical protein HeimAB125_07870 [Candidatus Heimdallarchaeota archaeon AB_125]
MLDIEEFHKIRKELFENKDKVHNSTDIAEYIRKLEIISANEKSEEVLNIIKEIIQKTENKIDKHLLFKLNWFLFLQSYGFQKIEETEKILLKLSEIAKETKQTEHMAIFYSTESLFYQLKGDHETSINKISESMEIIRNKKNSHKEVYYAILYAYTVFHSNSDKQYSKAAKNMQECFQYYYESSYNTLGMIKSFYLLIRFYILLGKDKKMNELFHWILNQEKIQERLIDTHYIILHWYLGIISTVRYRLDEAIDYLVKVYSRIKKSNLSIYHMYEFADSLRLLSRCYALKGNFQESYNLLTELVNFMELDNIKQNYYQRRRKLIYFSSYYTILFIFAQLDIDVEKIEDQSLLQVYRYIKLFLEESQLAKQLLLENSLDEETMLKTIEKESMKSKDEVYLTLYQFLTTQETYRIDNVTEKTLDKIRNFTHEPAYMDVFLGKIYLSRGNFKQFRRASNNVSKQAEKTGEPILQIWSNFFSLILEFIDNPVSSTVANELTALEEECKDLNFQKIAEEISMYKNLILTSSIRKDLDARFQRTAFLDLIGEESKKLVIETLQKD